MAKGFRQVEGVDYEETFAPTVRFESVRALAALAAGVGWELDQMDVTTAFLYAELDEETYIEIPEGVAHGVRQHLSRCAMLKKHIHTLLMNTQDNEC